jgi:hypothetical protein
VCGQAWRPLRRGQWSSARRGWPLLTRDDLRNLAWAWAAAEGAGPGCVALYMRSDNECLYQDKSITKHTHDNWY